MVCLQSFVRVKVLSVFLTEPYLYLGKRYPSLFWKSVKLILAQQDHKSLRRGWKSENTAQVGLSSSLSQYEEILRKTVHIM